MNLKEFDYKQFLLEKGERVGLGVAVTLMVLMLLLSLFMPSRGFFSGSPSKNADLLDTGGKQLDSALNTAQPTEAQLPGNSKGRLIALDTERLNPSYYETTSWFTSDRGDSKSRRPPSIYNLDESAADVAFMDVDTYLFNKDFTTVVVLRDKEGRAAGGAPAAAGGAGGKGNPFSRMYGPGSGGMPPLMPPGGGPGGGGNPMMQSMRQQFGRFGNNIQGAEDKPEYQTTVAKLTNLDSSAQLARQLRPVRMAIVAGSFPYKNQLEEHKSKLHLPSIHDVLYEGVEEEKGKQLAAFRFLGLRVERKEVDADGKDVTGWKPLDLKENYALWLLHSGLPFEEDDQKYDLVKPIDGLVMPRLREFREEAPQNPVGMMGPRMPMPGIPGAPGAPGGAVPRDDTQKPAQTKYPPVEDKLQKIADTLTKLEGVKPKQIAKVPDRFRKNENFDPFNPGALSVEEQPAAADANAGNDQTGGETIPEHVLVRFVDVTIDPGKSYRYRVKVRMANPNYGRADVASPSYKEGKELESKDWYEVPQTVSVPSELTYYVCDEKQLNRNEKHPADMAIAKLWQSEPSRDRQVVFQLHRWVESNPIIPNGELTPVGEWAIADRVLVSRGEFVGQPVKVDVPVWKYTLDSFVLPAEDQKRRVTRTGKAPTGVTVNFGTDNADSNTILVDFDGPRHYREFSIPGPDGQPKTLKVDDTTGIDVLMLSPEGKLLARNSTADSKDEKRTDRRKQVMDRLAAVREGKSSSGPAGGGSGLDTPRGK
jgi:hypothetical protein